MPLPALGGSFLTIQVQVASAQVSGKGRGFRVAKANFSKQGKANVILMHTLVPAPPQLKMAICRLCQHEQHDGLQGVPSKFSLSGF